MIFILQWIDLIWLFLAVAIVHKSQRWVAAGFVAGCMLMLRLQTELMESIDHANGIVGIMDAHVFYRGLFVYSFFYMLYLVLAHYSQNSKPVILMAASISLFFIVLFLSTIVMVL